MWNARTRLLLTFSALTGVLILFYSVFLYALVSHQLESIFQKDLIFESKFAQQLLTERGPTGLGELDEISKEAEINFRLLNPEKSVLFQSSEFDQDQDPQLDVLLPNASEVGHWQEATLHQEPHTILTQTFGFEGKTHTIQVIAPRDDLMELKNSISFWAMCLIPFAMALALLVGFFYSKNTLKPLEEGYLRMNRFTADASHELRIPVTGIKGILEVSLRKKRSPEAYIESIEDALGETNRLQRLVEDLLDLARGDAGTLALNKENISLKELILETVEQSKNLKNPHEVTLHVLESPADLVFIDTQSIKRCFLNLIDNAFKYNKPHGRVEIGATIDKKMFTLFVSDSGPGIAPEDQKRVFERFYRTDKARSRQQGGAGLGLAIVKSIVEAHGGFVSLTSQLGSGSRFELHLPKH